MRGLTEIIFQVYQSQILDGKKLETAETFNNMGTFNEWWYSYKKEFLPPIVFWKIITLDYINDRNLGVTTCIHWQPKKQMQGKSTTWEKWLPLANE